MGIFWFIIFFMSISAFSQELKIVYGNELYYRLTDEFKKIKEFSHGSFLRGYDMIDSEYIFLAYQKKGPQKPSRFFQYII